MSWKHWAAVLAVIGIGILVQIPRHERETVEHGHAPALLAPVEEAQSEGPYRTVALEVAGMT